MIRTKRYLLLIITTGFCLFVRSQSKTQHMPDFRQFAPIPDPEGMAGMFAGVSNGTLFCMGGANFPGKKPWEGGKKIWYDKIYMLDKREVWVELDQKLPAPLAYGISVEYKDEIIIVGGSDDRQFHRAVRGLRWDGSTLRFRDYPPLPVPMANMAGCRVGSLVIVAGGTSGPQSAPMHDCYTLDLDDPAAGWTALPAWPGPERTQPVSGSWGGYFHLFSGETIRTDTLGNGTRRLLQDAYRMKPEKKDGKWTCTWETLPVMPKAASASANPVPVLANGDFVFWGGVDAEIVLHRDPATHPGIGRKIFTYHAPTGTWSYHGLQEALPSRVTLPSVQWKGRWLYVSGEVKPGIRTNTIVSVGE
jgi:N-acetylneuraminic acid mutarotase